MKKSSTQPNLQEKILIFIGYCLPEARYKFSYQKLKEIFHNFYQTDYSLPTLRKEFSILKHQNLITYKTRYRKKIPTLTREGKLKIIPHLPYKKFEPWDKKWRIVIIDSPEKERKFKIILQNKLKDLGFKKIHSGVYISPHPLLTAINRLSNELGIRQNLTLIEADKIDREKRAIQKIWDLEEINQKYKEFIIETRKIRRRKFWPLAAKLFEQKFYEIYKIDPHLPAEFLPSNWFGKRAYQIYKQIALSY